MINIKQIATDTRHPVLLLRGKLMREDVTELRKACEQYLKAGKEIKIDLVYLRFVDIHGIRALKELSCRGVLLNNSSLYISNLIEAFNDC